MTTDRPRARDLGIPLPGRPGAWNAITDVAGVEVGTTTCVSGAPVAGAATGTVRTGVTVILPRGHRYDPVFAGWSVLNGNGEMTGTAWVAESGFLEGPVALTNTHSVGTVHEALIRSQVEAGVVGEGGALAFSTANPGAARRTGRASVEMMPNDVMTPLFHAVAEATEEAILNALVAAETMAGACGRRAVRLDREALCTVLARHGVHHPANGPTHGRA